MKSFYLTDTGRVREHNEDSVTILKNLNGEYLAVVADGMGGHRKGEVASALTVAHLGKRFTESASIGTISDAVNWLSDNINEINKAYSLILPHSWQLLYHYGYPALKRSQSRVYPHD